MPTALKATVDPKLLATTENLKANNPRPSSLLGYLQQTGQIKTPGVEPVVKPIQSVMKPMSKELPVQTKTVAPIQPGQMVRPDQPLIAGNVSQTSLKSKKLSIPEFAQKIKAKYPDYQNIDDASLVDKIIAKYPEYADKVDYNIGRQITQAPQRIDPQFKIGETPVTKSLKGSLAGNNGPFNRIDPVAQDMRAGGLDYVGGHIKNWGTSLYNILPDLGNAAANPKQTVKGIGNALLGTLINIGDKVGEVTGAGKLTDTMAMLGLSDSKVGDIVKTSDMTADQLGNILVDRYGSVEKLSKTAYEDPTGVLSDALTIIGGAGVALKGVTAGSKIGTAGKISRVADDLIKVGSLDPYNIATEGAIKGAVGTAKLAGRGVKMAGNAGVELLGKATGTSADTIKEIYRTAGSKGTTDAMRGMVTDESILKSVTNGLEEIKDQRRVIYGNDYEILKNSTKKVNTSGIKTKFTNELLDGLNIKIVDGGLDFSQSKVTSKKAQGNIIDMYEDISKWTDNSPAGIDILKQRVSDYWGGTPETAKADRLSTMLSNDLKGLVVKEVPEYARMMTKYEDMSNLIKDIKQTLSVGGKSATSTAITKLKGALRQNQEFRQTMIKQIEKYSGENIMGQLAGTQMNPLMPRGLAGVGAGVIGLGVGYLLDPTFIGGLIATSPRIVGEITNALGISAKKVQSYVDNIKKMIKSDVVQPQGNITRALPQETSTNIGTRQNPIIGKSISRDVIEKGTAKKPGTTKVDPNAIVKKTTKQAETPVKTVPKKTETVTKKSEATIQPKANVSDDIPDKKTIQYYEKINQEWSKLKDQDFRNNVETLTLDEFENMSPTFRKRYDKLLENEILQSDDYFNKLRRIQKDVEKIEAMEQRIGKVGKNKVNSDFSKGQEKEWVREKELAVQRIGEQLDLDQFESKDLYDNITNYKYDNTTTTQGKITKSIIGKEKTSITEKIKPNDKIPIAKKENGSIMDGMKTTKETKIIPKDLKPLYDEARKFDSVDDFVDKMKDELAKTRKLIEKPKDISDAVWKKRQELGFDDNLDARYFIKGVGTKELDKYIGGKSGRMPQLRKIREEANK